MENHARIRPNLSPKQMRDLHEIPWNSFWPSWYSMKVTRKTRSMFLIIFKQELLDSGR